MEDQLLKLKSYYMAAPNSGYRRVPVEEYKELIVLDFARYIVEYFVNRYLDDKHVIACIFLHDNSLNLSTNRRATLNFWFGGTANATPELYYSGIDNRYYVDTYYNISELPVIIDLLRNETVKKLEYRVDLNVIGAGSTVLVSKLEPIGEGERRSFFPFPRPGSN
jgi:hypothetical protein